MSRPQSDTNKLQLNNTSIPLQDARLAAGTHFPPTTTDYPHDNDNYAGYPGDIYLVSGDNVVQTSNGWEYVLRNGGWCECWKTFSFTDVQLSSSAIVGAYWANVVPTLADRQYPIPFIEVPLIEQGCTGGANTGGGKYCFFLLNGPKVNNTSVTEASLLTHLPPIYVARTSSVKVTGKIFVIVRGRIG